MRRYIMLFRLWQGVPLSPYEQIGWDLDVRAACALAAEGNLAGALKLVSKYENDCPVDKSMLYGRLGDIFQYAGQYEKMIEYKEKSAEYSKAPTYWIDLSFAHGRYFQDSMKAREVLDKIERKEITAIEMPFVKFIHGMIMLEEGRHDEACKLFEEAHSVFLKNFGTPIVKGAMAEVRVYWVIALAQTGRKEEARMVFGAAEALIQAQSDHALLSRYYQAVKGL